VARIVVKVQAGAKGEGLVGRDPDGALRLRVRAPAHEGKANQAVEGLLAARLGIAKAAIRLMHGAATRQKVFEVQGIEKEALEARITAALEAETETR
jgi:uncharacterized protein YggU (UPF0235/DUF167 family)